MAKVTACTKKYRNKTDIAHIFGVSIRQYTGELRASRKRLKKIQSICHIRQSD